MAETAALLVDNVLPQQPVRQWVLSLPFALRFLLAVRPEVVTQVLGIVYRAVSSHLIRKAGLTHASAVTGAVTLIQRFGGGLNLNVHFHLLVLDGVYRRLRRVFAIDIGTCRQCGGRLRVIARIEAPAVIERILEHLGRDAGSVDPAHPSRAPPKGDRLV